MKNALVPVFLLSILFPAGCANYKEIDIDGKVIHASALTGVTGVLIESGNTFTKTSDDGQFVLRGEIVKSGTSSIRLYCTKNGFQPTTKWVDVTRVTHEEGGETIETNPLLPLEIAMVTNTNG